MTDEAPENSRASEGWEAGGDGEITLVDVGVAGSIETFRSQLRTPVPEVMLERSLSTAPDY